MSDRTSYSYVVTSQKPTAVTCSVAGHFTSPDKINLIVAKSNHFLVMNVTAEGLKPVRECTVFGRISNLLMFRSLGASKDRLFLLTSKYNAMILEGEFSEDDKFEIRTKAFGNVQDSIGRPSTTGNIAIIDPQSEIIVLRLYDSIIKIIEITKESRELSAFNIRIEELEILDMCFLHGFDAPTIAILHQDPMGRHIKTYEISVSGKELNPGPFSRSNVETGASRIVPVEPPVRGLLVIGEESIIYMNGTDDPIAIAPSIIQESAVTCCGKIDPRRFILGDESGNLIGLELECDDAANKVSQIRVDHFGVSSIPEALSYLDNGVMFLGSRLGDSHLLRFEPPTGDSGRGSISVIETYSNCGPICDLCVVKLEKQSQAKVVTCSGAYKDGSLRVIRSGVGVSDMLEFDALHLRGVFAFHVESEFDNYMLISMEKSSALLKLNEEIEESRIESLQLGERTVWCGNVEHAQIAQVVESGVRVISEAGMSMVADWASTSAITVASCNQRQILVCCTKMLHYLTIGRGEVKHVKSVLADDELSDVTVHPLFESGEDSHLAASCTWNTFSAHLWKLPTLEVMNTIRLSDAWVTRSICLLTLDRTMYCVVGMGEGSIQYFSVNPFTGEFGSTKQLQVAFQPVYCRPVFTKTGPGVIALTDKPCILFSSAQKLYYSYINFKPLTYMCQINSKMFPNCFVLAGGDFVHICKLDDIRKLQIDRVPLGETPHRVVSQPTSGTLGVIVYGRCRMEGPNTYSTAFPTVHDKVKGLTYASGNKFSFAPQVGQECELYSFVVCDINTIEPLWSLRFRPQEYAVSLVSGQLGDDPDHYYVVGTAYVNPEEAEPRSGRLLVLKFSKGQVEEVAEKEVKGAPFCLRVFNKKLLAGINNTVKLFEWAQVNSEGLFKRELRPECTYHSNVMVLYLKTRNDFVLVGDLMRSIALLAYRDTGIFEEVARDFNPKWMTAVEIIDDDHFIGAENSFNLFTCKRNSGSVEEDRLYLTETGMMHLGDFVNVFEHGSLVEFQMDKESLLPTEGSILFGTAMGAIGMITQLTPERFQCLDELQRRIAKAITSIGKIEHGAYRNYATERRTEPFRGFVDGDLIEMFLELDEEQKKQVARDFQVGASTGSAMAEWLQLWVGTDDKGDAIMKTLSVDELTRLVEELSRMH